VITEYTREPSKKCMRCGLEYKVSEGICPHCVGKSNAQIIKEVHIPHAKELEQTTRKGRYFIYLFVITLCLLLAVL